MPAVPAGGRFSMQIPRTRTTRPWRRCGYSAGVWILLGIAAISSLLVVLPPRVKREGYTMWYTSRNHARAYEPFLEQWNAEHPDKRFHFSMFTVQAIERRMMSGFLSGTPVPELVEIPVATAAQAFRGPEEDIGLVDLTDRLKSEGLLETINPPSFSPWTHGGRIYGLPHDVHPVLLAYRADIIEAAGIDMNQIETWEDFTRVLRPLVTKDAQGRPTRFLLNAWLVASTFEPLLLQAGGGIIGQDGRATLDTAINAKVMARVVTWTSGPGRIAVDSPELSAGGNQLRLEGTILAFIMPDWLTGVWKHDLPGLAGRIKLMPLPAWEKGGRRTSVAGGSMLGIPKRAKNVAAAWEFAKALYLNPDLAEDFYRTTGVIPPEKTLWSLPVFSEPDPYFCGQPAGKLFIEQAPNVPLRISSAYQSFAQQQFVNAALSLRAVAEEEGIFDLAELEKRARPFLQKAQAQVVEQMNRNIFAREQQP